MKKCVVYIGIGVLIIAGILSLLYLKSKNDLEKETKKVENVVWASYEIKDEIELETYYEILGLAKNKEELESTLKTYSFDDQITLKTDFEKNDYLLLIMDEITEEEVQISKIYYKYDKTKINIDYIVQCEGVFDPIKKIYIIELEKDKVDIDKIEINRNEKRQKECEIYIAYKPVLYLYPEKTTEVTINFKNENRLTTTYPKFEEEWKVTANPNGDLYDEDGKYYYGLYWEEDLNHDITFNTGFYVTKDNAIEFLEEKLSFIGLNDKERNEFIMYWLPILEKNEQNLIYFELTDELQNNNELIINPQPDSLLRIRMHVKKVNKETNIKEQELTSFERKGFTAVEWGGVIY